MAEWRLAGVGVDVVDVPRLSRLICRQPRLLRHLCAPEELLGLDLEHLDAARAARLWSGKEAVAKTLGTGFWQSGVGWPDVQLRAEGIVLTGRAREVAGEYRVHLDYTELGVCLIATALRWAPPTARR